MNIEALNRAVQWVIDTYAIETGHLAPRSDNDEHRNWRQTVWGSGTATEERLQAALPGDRSVREFSTVACTSGCCVAGDIVLDAGDKFVTPYALTPGTTTIVDHCISRDGVVSEIADRATQILGVDDVGYLFSGDNLPGNVYDHATSLATEHGEMLSVDLRGIDPDDLPRD